MNANFVCQNASSSASFQSTSSRKTSKFVVPVLALLALLCGMSASVQAQTATYSGVTTAFGTTTGFTVAEGIAADPVNGNLFVAATDGTAWNVFEMTSNGSGGYNAPVGLPTGGGYACTTTPCLRNLAVDTSHNVWVADFGGHVYEVAFNSGTSTYAAPVDIAGPAALAPTLAGWHQPWGVAVDTVGNVFVSDFGANAIAEIPAGTGTAVWVAAAGFSQPVGLAVNPSNSDLYVLDGNNDHVVQLIAPSYTTANAVSASVSGGLGNLSRDANGNIWVTNYNANLIIELTGWNSTTYATALMWGSGLNGPVGILPGATGNVLVTNEFDGSIKQIATQQPNFANLALNASPVSLTLKFTAQGTPNIGAPTVVTQGATSLDFSNPTGWTCAAYFGNTQCDVTVNFSPTAPGPRAGAVRMVDNTGLLLGEQLVSGTGTGPQITYSPSAGTANLGTFSAPQKLAVDGSGNVFVADTNTSSVYKISAGVSTPIASGLSNPYGVAVDGAGDVFVALSGTGQIEEVYAAGVTPYSTSRILATTFDGPLGLAFDGSGNLYVAEAGNHNDIVRLTAANDYGDPTHLGSFTLPYAVAVDGSGNIWVADRGAHAVVELSSAGATKATFTSFTSPEGIAVDPAGDVYVADNATGNITELTASSNYATSVTLASVASTPAVSAPTGIALDVQGNVYYSNSGDGTVDEINLTTAPGLAFGNQGYKTPSAPRSITFSNIGNADLNFVSITPSPADYANVGTGGDCVVGTPVAAGASCPLAITLTPQSIGSIPGTATLTDNAVPSPQTIILSGTGTKAAVTLSWASPSPIVYGTTLNGMLNATASCGSCGTFSYSASGVGAVTNATTLTVSGSPYTLTATFTLTDTTHYNPPSSSQVTVSLTVTKATPTASTPPTASPITYGQTLASSTITPGTMVNGATTVAGTFAFTTPTTAPNAGTPSESVTFTPTDTADYNSATLSVSVIVSKATPTITTPPTASAITYGQTLASSTLTGGSGSVAGSFAWTTPTIPPGAGNPSESVTFTPTDTANYNPVNGAVNVVVNKANTTVTWAAPAAIIYGTPLSATQLNATASVPGGFAYTPPAGTILPVGTGQTLSVTFTPNDSTNYNSSSTTTTITVAATGLTVSANSATRVYGTANPTFTGTITGQQNGDTFTESFTTSATIASNVGTYPIVPSANGTNLASYAVVTNNGTLTITKANTTTGLTAGGSSVNPGATVTLTATVASATSGTPTGSVSFYDGTNLLGTGALSAGVATYSTTTLAAGASHTLTAIYSGDTNFNTSSTSTSTDITVGVLDFTLGNPSPADQSGSAGTAFTYSFGITPTYGSYAGTVNFTATGLPAGATATFSPSSIQANGGPQTVTLIVATAAGSAALVKPAIVGRGLVPVALAFLLLPLAGTKRMRREGRRLGRQVCMLLLVLAGLGATAAVTGCGSHSGSLSNTQTYTVTITATSGALQHTATVTLDLKQ